MQKVKDWSQILLIFVVVVLLATNIFLIIQNIQLKKAVEQSKLFVTDEGYNFTELKFKGLDGNEETVDLSDGKHKTLLLVFNTSCDYCVQQYPYWKELIGNLDPTLWRVMAVTFELTAIVSAEETGRTNFNANDLFMISGFFTGANVPIEIQKKFFKTVINKSRDALQMPSGDADTAFFLLSGIISEISTKFPELLQEASNIQLALKIRVSQTSKEAQERAERIKNSPDKLSALISEAERTDNQAEKYDLYVSAAQLALKMEKFKYAVDIAEETVEINKSKTRYETFRKQWHDQFLGQVAEKALKANDPDSANYATKKIMDLLTKAEILKKTANYYFDRRDPVSASYSLDDAIKLTVKAENTPRRIASFINLISAVQKIDPNRVSDLSELTAKSINAIPSLNVEDKPQTENYKNYVTSVMDINWNLLPALMNLVKENRSEVTNFANTINKKEIKVIADYVLMSDSILQMTKREKEQSKR